MSPDWGCALCGRQPASAGELPSGQPLCSECVDHWRRVQVYVLRGRSRKAHLNDWCTGIEAALGQKNQHRYGAEELDVDDVLLEKQLGQVPSYSICHTCWSKAGRALERRAAA